jgi:hypothetical protein
VHSWDPEAARARSVAALARYDITPPPHLPRLGEEDVGATRPIEDIVARCQALHGVLDVIHGAPLDHVDAALTTVGADRWLSESERQLFGGIARGEDVGPLRLQLSWRAEALTALAWALELLDELPIEAEIPLERDTFAPVNPVNGPAPPLARRAPEAVAERLDLLYCAHWATRQHEHHGLLDEWPQELVAGSIWERRHGLEWYFAPTVEWDDIELHT